MSVDPLSEEEIRKLRALIPHAEAIEKQAQYRAAIRLLSSTWRGSVIFYGGALAAIIMFTDDLKEALKALVKALAGGG